MGIDYEGLYARDYFGHQPGSRSFQPRFPGLLATLARALGCEGVLDVGSSNGDLARHLREGGLASAPLDLRGDQEAGVLPFDLTANDPEQVARLCPDLRPRTLDDLRGSVVAASLDALPRVPGTVMALARRGVKFWPHR